MPSFWRVSIKGTANGQEVANVLYYVDDSTGTATFDPAKMTDLAQGVEIGWDNAVCPLVSDNYVGTGLTVDLVNEYNEVSGNYPVEVEASFAGGSVSDTDTPAQAVICAFRVGDMAEGQAAPVPRRSYVAIGPLTNGVLNDAGQVTWTPLQQAQITDFLSGTITVDGTTFRPCRVGRGRADNQPSYGEVSLVIMRPYGSFRRSRMFTPTGR